MTDTQVEQLLLEKFIQLSLNVHGACVLKKFIFCCEHGNLLLAISNIIFNNFMLICKNSYGNYVIQELMNKVFRNLNKQNKPQFDLGLGLNMPMINYTLRNIIFVNFISLSVDPFGYFIAEYFIKIISKEEAQKILMNLLQNQTTFFNFSNMKLGRQILGKLYQKINNQINQSC